MSQLESYIENNSFDTSISSKMTQQDFVNEVVLPSDILESLNVLKASMSCTFENPKHVFLTGATGFLGSYLLYGI